MEDKIIGVIGGSGLYMMDGLEDVEEVDVDTPFGRPSDKFIRGRLDGVGLVFLARHGRGHKLMPSELNFRANIYGMKTMGVSRIIAVSAVGSMREGLRPGDVVIPDQFFDRTRGRINTFFGGGVTCHITFSDPVCPVLSDSLYASSKEAGADVHKGGTYICIEGPQFSTRAESLVYRQWGVEIIGMTNLPEARLAREAEVCYSTLAMITDYDCWHDTEADVTINAVLDILKKNAHLAQDIIRHTVEKIPTERNCECASALRYAVITKKELIPEDLKRDLKPILGKYI